MKKYQTILVLCVISGSLAGIQHSIGGDGYGRCAAYYNANLCNYVEDDCDCYGESSESCVDDGLAYCGSDCAGLISSHFGIPYEQAAYTPYWFGVLNPAVPAYLATIAGNWGHSIVVHFFDEGEGYFNTCQCGGGQCGCIPEDFDWIYGWYWWNYPDPWDWN